ncbi:MAG TPA: thiol:disulfide interchange protein DsbA/DsbL [Woeseiaceae bacterium]|nr:thiol:disulfide interchange protein DsbA/DsbL [Woeseiaceae bacterium]
MKPRLLLLPLTLAALTLAACGQESGAPASDAAQNRPAAEQAAPEAAVAETPAREEAQPVPESAGETARDEAPADDRALRLAGSGGNKEQSETRFTEGRHYTRLMPAQPTMTGGDRIEVAEVFWYGCVHCATFDPIIEEWAGDIPADVVFVRIPAVWNRTLQTHGRAFYTAEVLARSGALQDPEGLHKAFFAEYHGKGNTLASEGRLKEFFARFGVDEESFDKAWNSFEVDQKLRRAADLNRRYGITGVPAIVVNGKYRTGGQEAGGYDTLLEVIDELVAVERP